MPYPATIATAPLFDLLLRWEQLVTLYRKQATEARTVGRHIRVEAAAEEMDRCRQDLLDLIDASRQYDEHRTVCDAQEHATEDSYRACPICNAPFPEAR
jgi:hypothetical protein